MSCTKCLNDIYEKEYSDYYHPIEFLSSEVFNFTTYDGNVDSLFVQKAVEVCQAINDGKTFDYIANNKNYIWYILMLNTPFFEKRIDWGCSIRGAFWSYEQKDFEIGSKNIKFRDGKDWSRFISHIIEFYNECKNVPSTTHGGDELI